MATLNARAHQAFREWAGDTPVSDVERSTFEEGWETGYKARQSELTWWVTTGPTGDRATRRIAGPFSSKDEAMENRVTIEQYTTPVTFWIVEDPS